MANYPTGARLGKGEVQTVRSGRQAAGDLSPFLSSCLVVLPLAVILLLGRTAGKDSPDLSCYPWLYLRDGEPLAGDGTLVEVIAVGDVMLGRGLTGEERVLGAVAPWLRAADLTVGNLESVLASNPPKATSVSAPPKDGSGTGFLLRASPEAAEQLGGAGFDLLGLANNHARDCGPVGLAETAQVLQAAGIAFAGAGPGAEVAFRPVVRETRGLKVAFLALSAVPDLRDGEEGGWAVGEWEPDRVASIVRDASVASDAVIVSIHWGYEYETRVDPAQRDAARLLVEAGADLVVGHHPHVVQAFEVVDGCGVAYSLGNFVFDQGQGDTGRGLALRAFFDEQGLRGVQGLPVWAGRRPVLVAPEEAGPWMTRIEPSPRCVHFACGAEACHPIELPRCEPRETPSARFRGGRIDLSGDGMEEHVRRVGGQVVVHSRGDEVWRSPPAWQVVDVALGDPNDDGRGEMLLALWKRGLDGLETPSPEKERMLRSHPFIIGYRGGLYRTLWGGSAVSSAILEVELADVDGDRTQELIVLADADRRERSVSVWHWHGWGFSQVWRSDPGSYRDLTVTDDGMIQVVIDDAVSSCAEG